MKKYAAMLADARRSHHFWAQAAYREFQSQILIMHEGEYTYKDMANAMGVSVHKYCALLRHNNLTLETMSEFAAAQGKRIRITVEKIP